MHPQVKTARAQWLAEEDGGIDDCTAIVCILHHKSMALHHMSSQSADVSKAVGAISRSSTLHVPKIALGNSSLHLPCESVHCLLLSMFSHR